MKSNKNFVIWKVFVISLLLDHIYFLAVTILLLSGREGPIIGCGAGEWGWGRERQGERVAQWVPSYSRMGMESPCVPLRTRWLSWQECTLHCKELDGSAGDGYV